uniref:Bidirectional sugar transporter SWEET n=1 Tax=Rhizophora mucronata TaxID=61149 RepID=A0A2P2QLQ6_RHIMU
MGILRLALGVLGNAASLLQFAAPIGTFARVIKKKSTEEFSCVPYIVTLLNCLLYTWYGLPVVSIRWENLPLVTINATGILLEISFVLIYFWFCPTKSKMKVAALVIPVFSLFGILATVSAFAVHDHHLRKLFVGCIGAVVSASMYASPLVAVKRVIKTKSVEFMPFYLSFFSFLSSSLWMAFGLMGKDFVVAAPNFVGAPLSFLQLALYVRYRKRGVVLEEPMNWDPEKNAETTKQLQQLQPVTDESTNEKN